MTMFLTTIAIATLTHPLHVWLICLILARIVTELFRRAPQGATGGEIQLPVRPRHAIGASAAGRFAALFLVVLGTHAHATVLCATRKGVIVADERCRKHEERIEPRDLGFVGHVGPRGADGAAGPDGAPVERFFRVVDANGKTACAPLARIGTSYLQCVLQPDAEAGPVQLVLFSNGRDAASPTVYYGAPSCEGPARTSEGATVLPRAKLLGARVFFAVGPRAPFSYRSVEDGNEQCSGGTRTPYGTCCTTLAQSNPSEGAPARSVELSALGLTAPLHAEER